MRNLLEHPITDQEIVDCLQDMASSPDRIDFQGHDWPLLLATAADIIACRNLGRVISVISAEDLAKHLPNLEARMGKLEAVADAARECIADNRAAEDTHGPSHVIWLAGSHRRIRLADALKALKA